MVIVSSVGKYHAFNLAEQLANRDLLSKLYTSYASQKNTTLRQIISRQDREEINRALIKTLMPVAFGRKIFPQVTLWDSLFDHWVTSKLPGAKGAKTFIGWSGSSLNSLQHAKKLGLTCILERGSSHILTQNELLHEEYKSYGVKNFSINKRNINNELKEYEAADLIVVPSTWAQQSFLNRGFDKEKIWVNNLGVSDHFKMNQSDSHQKPFRILYLGVLSGRKGLIYLFEALNALGIPIDTYEVWFIGQVSPEVQRLLYKFKKVNWKFWGHINHYELSKYINQCDVAVQPSVEEGLSMVMAQCLACGVPVIASVHTGAQDIITDGKNGYVVPVRDVGAIRDRLELVYDNRQILSEMSLFAAENTRQKLSWEKYGSRYVNRITKLST